MNPELTVKTITGKKQNKLAVERRKTTRKVIFCRESTHL